MCYKLHLYLKLGNAQNMPNTVLCVVKESALLSTLAILFQPF
jgi:hypothetical protein